MKSKDITLGAIMVALTCIILYSTSIIPINTLTILTIASAIVPVCIIRSNIKTAVVVYIASSILALLIVPINISVLYFLFFGVYGIVKYFAEKTKKTSLEILLKVIFFNIAFALGFVIFQNILGINITTGINEALQRFIIGDSKVISFTILFLVAQIVFGIYDYALTLIITFYMDRIHNRK